MELFRSAETGRYLLSPTLNQITTRTECHLDNEAAAVARIEFKKRSAAKRAEELARIERENEINRQHLAGVKEKVDDGDGPDEKADASGMRTLAMKSFQENMAQVYIAKSKSELAEHLTRLASASTTIVAHPTETYPYYPANDSIAKARAHFREIAYARRQAEAQALRERNAAYQERLQNTSSVTDSKIWDDGEGSAGAMRSVVAAQAKERARQKQREIAAQNVEMKNRLSMVGPPPARMPTTFSNACLMSDALIHC